MLDLAGLKNHPEIIAAIDWEMTPRRAFEAYQIKSPGNWRHRGLAEVYYFYLSLWRGESKLLLVKKGYVETEEIAEIAPPADLAARCAEACRGEEMPRGQCALDEPLKKWLRAELGL
jgi:hypothetical protein